MLPTEILQIGGRAGRFSITDNNPGFVTALSSDAVSRIRDAFREPLSPIARAGLGPSMEMIVQMSNVRSDLTLYQLFVYFQKYAMVDDAKFFMCNIEQQMKIAERLAHLGMSVQESHHFAMAPCKTSDPVQLQKLVDFATLYATEALVPLGDFGDIGNKYGTFHGDDDAASDGQERCERLGGGPNGSQAPKGFHQMRALESTWLVSPFRVTKCVCGGGGEGGQNPNG